jgi:exodeoxyribonuclease VII small subunit
MAEKKNDIAELSYEQARDELTRVLSELEAGSVTLEDSMKLWERGEALAKHCESLLAGARKKIEATLKDSAE